jgi:hypothetical protein
MITEELTCCPKCQYGRALTHWSSDNLINWIACPRCWTFFDHDIVKVQDDLIEEAIFWQHVEKDTDYGKCSRGEK